MVANFFFEALVCQGSNCANVLPSYPQLWELLGKRRVCRRGGLIRFGKHRIWPERNLNAPLVGALFKHDGGRITEISCRFPVGLAVEIAVAVFKREE